MVRKAAIQYDVDANALEDFIAEFSDDLDPNYKEELQHLAGDPGWQRVLLEKGEGAMEDAMGDDGLEGVDLARMEPKDDSWEPEEAGPPDNGNGDELEEAPPAAPHEIMTAMPITHRRSRMEDPDDIDPVREPEKALKTLMNPESILRVFEQPFVLPLLPYLEMADREIPPEIKVLRQQHDFYLVKYGFDALPQGKEKFSKVDIHIDYPDNQGFLTRDLIPDTQIEERFKAEGKVTVALDPHMNISVPEVDLGRGMSVGGGIEASSDSRFLLNWEYSLLDAKIIALGKKGSYAEWVIKEPRSMMGSVELTTILAVPRGTTEVPVQISGHYMLQRGIAWWKKETRVKIDGKSMITLPNSN